MIQCLWIVRLHIIHSLFLSLSTVVLITAAQQSTPSPPTFDCNLSTGKNTKRDETMTAFLG